YKSILRPDTQNTARGLVINDTETVFTTANPDLKPEYADNFEARVEYYFEPVGLISGGIFYKKLKDVQVTLQTIFDNTNVPEDVLAAGYTAADLIARSAQYNRTVNGPDTDVWGYELDYNQQLSFLPGHLKGFGVFANYTYTNPEEEFFFTGGSGVPKHAVNAGVTYKAQRFSGQIKFNWLGKRILATPGYSINPFTGQVVLGTVNATTGVQNPNAANSGRIDYEKERLQIDINLDYQLHRRATVFLNIANATGAESIRYAVKEANLIRHGGFGAKYTLGVKGSF
ncbi:MAG TPA: TonB-dependent receptor, partial [Opitutaceae bacterium]|nr:TonB-dependent receptor [Opitutaceae bacterium]